MAKAERAIEGLGGRHAGQRVKANAPVAKPTSLGHRRQRQHAPEPATPFPRAHVEALHLATIGRTWHWAHGDAAEELLSASLARQYHGTPGRGVVAGQTGNLVIETLEA